MSSKVKAVSKEHGIIKFIPVLNMTKNVFTTQANGSFGSITVNEIEAVNYRIWHSHFSIKADTQLTLTLQGEIPSFRFLFTLKRNMRFRFNEFGRGIRLKDQFNLLFNPNSDIQYVFQKDKEYAAVVVFFKYKWLQKRKAILPELSDIIEKIELGKPFLISRATTPQMRNVIHELLSDRDKRWYFIDAKVKELLNHVVNQLNNTQSRSGYIKLTPADIQKIEKARDHLQDNPGNPGTIVQLSRKIGLNEFTLKKGFKQLIGFTIHNYLVQERMIFATNLLKNTKLRVREIALMAGFKSYTYFVAAFKKRFGYSVRSIR